MATHNPCPVDLRLGDVQHAAVEIYLLDPAHDVDEEIQAARVALVRRGRSWYLTAPDATLLASVLTEAANSADNDDPDFCRALSSLAKRAWRAAYG